LQPTRIFCVERLPRSRTSGGRTRPYLASAARARCRSIRWRHSAYSLVPGRYSNDLHHSSSESSRCIDEQLPSISAASRSANLKIMATSALKRRTGDSGTYGGLVRPKTRPRAPTPSPGDGRVKLKSRDRRPPFDSASAVARVPHHTAQHGYYFPATVPRGGRAVHPQCHWPRQVYPSADCMSSSASASACQVTRRRSDHRRVVGTACERAAWLCRRQSQEGGDRPPSRPRASARTALRMEGAVVSCRRRSFSIGRPVNLICAKSASNLIDILGWLAHPENPLEGNNWRSSTEPKMILLAI
jgi:hypothetical protein